MYRVIASPTIATRQPLQGLLGLGAVRSFYSLPFYSGSACIENARTYEEAQQRCKRNIANGITPQYQGKHPQKKGIPTKPYRVQLTDIYNYIFDPCKVEKLPACESPYDYCDNVPKNICADSAYILDRAKRDCNFRTGVRGLGKICSLKSGDDRVTAANYHMWDPCRVALAPICSTPKPMLPEEPRTILPTSTPSPTPPLHTTVDVPINTGGQPKPTTASVPKTLTSLYSGGPKTVSIYTSPQTVPINTEGQPPPRAAPVPTAEEEVTIQSSPLPVVTQTPVYVAPTPVATQQQSAETESDIVPLDQEAAFFDLVEEEEDELEEEAPPDHTKYWIGGVVVLVAGGGLAYYLTRKKKKRRR